MTNNPCAFFAPSGLCGENKKNSPQSEEFFFKLNLLFANR